MNSINFLSKLGYTEIESKIYLALNKLQQGTAGQVINITGYHKATVYQTLNRLLEKGIVGYNIVNKTKIYYAQKPDIFYNQLKELEEEYDEIKNELKSVKYSDSKNYVITYIGKAGLKGALNQMLDELNPKGIYFDFGVSGLFKKDLPIYWEQFQKKKKQYKIKSYVIFNNEIKKAYPDVIKKYFGDYKILPNKSNSFVDTFIYKDKVLICIWDAEPQIAIQITSTQLAEAYKTNFKKSWEEL